MVNNSVNKENNKPLRRGEIRKIFRRHRGAQTRCAEWLGISRSMITMWLRRQRTSRDLDVSIPMFAAKVASGEIQIGGDE
jgi:predicted transcriptional regulator